MKRAFPLSALAHALLLALLYLDGRARQPDDAMTQERAARQRYAVLRREALEDRGLEPLDDPPRAATETPAPLATAPLAAAPLTAPPSAAAQGARSLLGRSRRIGWGEARGEAVSQNANEQTVLAELGGSRLTPGRVFLGDALPARWSFVDSWYTLGPFPEGRDPYPPEARVDLDAEYPGAAGALVRWRFLQSPRPEVVPETMTPYSVHYAYTKLRSDRDREAWLAFGADDKLKVWLNGELVWDCGEHWRPWVLDEGTRRVALRQGYNTLLARLDNWPDHGAFSVAIRVLP